ncbi:MAG: hypothetical protein H6625_13020 [Bdellovibrionaceae bacterium]|nr:hypothetical protein [Pseudobdellovibrionaceae bacterium]
MKLLLLVLLFSIQVLAKPLTIPDSIVQVKTKMTSSPTTGNISYRAVIISEGSEGGYRLILEKFKAGEEGAETSVLMTYQTTINKISGFEEFLKKIAAKSMEATYGCCEPVNVMWNNNNELHFDLFYKQRDYKKSNSTKNEIVHHFHCESSSLDQYKVDLKCIKK